MIRKTDFRQAEFNGAARIIHWLADRVVAERCVHMIIGGQLHKRSVESGEWRVEQNVFAVLETYASLASSLKLYA